MAHTDRTSHQSLPGVATVPFRRLAIVVCILLIPAAVVAGRHMGAVAAALLAVWLVLVGRREARWGERGKSEGEDMANSGPGRGGSPADGTESRPLLEGTIEIDGRTWEVKEERRGGPWSQLLILTARDGGHGVMHVRPEPGAEATTLEEAEIHAANPALRYFADDGEAWQVRRVQASGEGGKEIPMLKFISRDGAVRECRFSSPSGLGLLSDDSLRELLRGSREV
jgi:hypothetical protein